MGSGEWGIFYFSHFLHQPYQFHHLISKYSEKLGFWVTVINPLPTPYSPLPTPLLKIPLTLDTKNFVFGYITKNF
ncbi:MAG: hypothetical protein KME64_26390 [Scytonematopsis contorta HA4267-MV1]|nr:hypothetical protein [Scytonematopsis contorta HA4267-MV1]